jgi:Cu/Ag efflux protein CusF
MQDTRRYTGMVTQSALGPKAAIDLRTLALPAATVTLRVPHDDPKLAYVRDGTQIRLVSWQDNAIYRLRVLVRDLDLDSGVVTLTCDGVSDITRATQLNNWGWGGIPTQGSA